MRAGAQRGVLLRLLPGPWACVLLATLGVATVAQAESPQAGQKLEQARALYLAGRYGQACPLFAEMTRAHPEDGAAWADLGLCELRRGRREASIQALLHAVREGDEQVRASAYHNLSLAGHRIQVPTARDTCLELEAPPPMACTKRARLCAHEHADSGTGGGIVWQGVWVTDTDNFAPPPQEQGASDELREDGAAMFLSSSVWSSTRACDPSGAFSPPAFERAVERCRRTAPEEKDCVYGVRLALAPDPDRAQAGFPLTAKEKKVIREASRQCLRELEAQMREGSGTYCHIVSVDPCRRRVGVACDAQARQRFGLMYEREEPLPTGKRLHVQEHIWKSWTVEKP